MIPPQRDFGPFVYPGQSPKIDPLTPPTPEKGPTRETKAKGCRCTLLCQWIDALAFGFVALSGFFYDPEASKRVAEMVVGRMG